MKKSLLQKYLPQILLLNKLLVFPAIFVIGYSSVFLYARGSQKSERLVLTLGSQDNPDSISGRGILAARAELERLSGGSMTLDAFFSSQLGDYKAMASQVSSGELDMLTSGYPDMSFLVSAFEVIGEPYVVGSYEQLLKVVQGDFAARLHRELLEQNQIRFLDVWYTGARQVTSKRPLESIRDFQGLKLRTPNTPFLIHFAEAAGAIPSPIAFQEVYLALQTNQVEAQENPLTTINTMKFYEVQDYIAITNHFIASVGVWIHQNTWESLTAQQREWLEQALAAGRKLNNELAFADEEALIANFQERGLTITRPDIAPFRESMAPFYRELNAKYADYGDDLIGSLQKLR